MLTEDQFEKAVEMLCNEAIASRTSIEMGSWEDLSDRFSVEIANWHFGVRGSPLTLGGWVDIDEERENISCLLGLIYTDRKGEKHHLGECEGLVGYYDPDIQEWELEWDYY